jgi:hypothetical protein
LKSINFAGIARCVLVKALCNAIAIPKHAKAQCYDSVLADIAAISAP